MAKSGLPKKYAKLGFAKGWKAFKSAKRKLKGVLKRKKKSTKKSPAKMLKRKSSKKSNTTSKKQLQRRPRKMAKRNKKWVPQGAMGYAINSGVAGGTAVGSTVLLNKMEWFKTMNPWLKATIQLAIGFTGLAFSPKKSTISKVVAGGVGAGAIITLISPTFGDNIKLPFTSKDKDGTEPKKLTGSLTRRNSRPLSHSELKNIQMGAPYGNNTVPNNTNMGAPIVSNSMGAPIMSGGNRAIQRTRRNLRRR